MKKLEDYAVDIDDRTAELFRALHKRFRAGPLTIVTGKQVLQIQ